MLISKKTMGPTITGQKIWHDSSKVYEKLYY